MIPREWIFSHRCSWIMVYVFCRNAQSESHSDPHDICTLSLLYQLPNCNLFIQHVLFILWRDTTSELLTPVQFPLHCYIILFLLALFTFLHTIILLPLDTLNPLFIANRWDSQPHRKLGAKFLVMLCAGFMLLLVEDTPTSILSGALVRSVTKLASITFWSLTFSYWFDSTLVSRLREDLLLCSSYLLLGFPTGRSSISTPHHQGPRRHACCSHNTCMQRVTRQASRH
jgi:hypothetical protein